MDNILFSIIILNIGAFISHGLVLQKAEGDRTNYYEIDTVKDERNVVNLNNSEDNTEHAYIILVPKEGQDYKILLDQTEDYNKYVIIKSELKLLDLDSLSLIHRHDKSSRMVKWLNLYCDMHPDCDKNKLNEELRKVRPYLEF